MQPQAFPRVMTGDQYVAAVVRKYAVSRAPGSAASKAANLLVPLLKDWAGQYLLGIHFSGSYAKGTAISLGTDVDIFVSVDCAQPVNQIYWSLFQYCVDHQLRPQVQNVSVGVQSNGLNVDLVPGRRQKGNTTDHTLYKRKKDTWVQTNVAQHIQFVSTSGRADEIRALKIWRERNYLDFPSFYLELTIIEALKHKRSNSPADKVLTALKYLEETFIHARVVDPANSNNVISHDVGPEEKRVISAAARKCLVMRTWEQILW